MSYSTSTDPARMQLDVIHRYLARSYWSPGIRRDLVEKAVRSPGSVVIGAFDDSSGAQVGFARAVTDQATFAWLCDVFVLEPHRGKGLSKRMVGELLDDPRLVTLRQWMLGTRDAHSLYQRFGFEPGDPGRLMRRPSPREAWQDPALLNEDGSAR